MGIQILTHYSVKYHDRSAAIIDASQLYGGGTGAGRTPEGACTFVVLIPIFFTDPPVLTEALRLRPYTINNLLFRQHE